MQTLSGDVLPGFQRNGTKETKTVCIGWWRHSTIADASFGGLSAYIVNRCGTRFQIGAPPGTVQLTCRRLGCVGIGPHRSVLLPKSLEQNSNRQPSGGSQPYAG